MPIHHLPIPLNLIPYQSQIVQTIPPIKRNETQGQSIVRGDFLEVISLFVASTICRLNANSTLLRGPGCLSLGLSIIW